MSIGRGLGALITPTGPRKKQIFATGGDHPERIWLVPVSEIKPNPTQPRRQFKDAELQDLADSIKEHGVLQPLLVTELSSGGYEIIAGERRWRASQLAGLGVVPVIVKAMADQQKLEVALIENIQREDLNPVEEAYAYKRLIEEFGLTQEEVATKVGKSRPAIANAIRLLNLPEEVQTALIHGAINTGQARALLTLDDPRKQLEMLASMQGEKITVRELERTVKTTTGTPSRRDPNLLYLEEELRSKLGTKVTISDKAGKGTIAISFFSKEELKELIKKIVG